MASLPTSSGGMAAALPLLKGHGLKQAAASGHSCASGSATPLGGAGRGLAVVLHCALLCCSRACRLSRLCCAAWPGRGTARFLATWQMCVAGCLSSGCGICWSRDKVRCWWHRGGAAPAHKHGHGVLRRFGGSCCRWLQGASRCHIRRSISSAACRPLAGHIPAAAPCARLQRRPWPKHLGGCTRAVAFAPHRLVAVAAHETSRAQSLCSITGPFRIIQRRPEKKQAMRPAQARRKQYT